MVRCLTRSGGLDGMILLIGYGNVLRRDDGAGVALLRLVEQSCSIGEMRCIETHQLLPELAAEIAAPDVAGVLFLDARPSTGGREEPAVRSVRLAPAPESMPLGHHLSPETLLAFAGKLYGRTLPAWLVTVEGKDFGHGEGLSGEVQRSLPMAGEMVAGLLAEMDRLRRSNPTAQPAGGG